jgi:pimeloyl-ACP methyl ester carboxylesterase
VIHGTSTNLLWTLLLVAGTGCPYLSESAVPPPREGTIRSFDQVPIAYETQGRGRTALVFVHCWGCDRQFWREQMPAMADDFRVVSLDLAGHGGSGTNRTSWRVADLARDVQAVVEGLELRRVILVGHSMGGVVSLLAAARMPGRVIGVVGVDTLHNAEWSMPREAMQAAVGELESNFPAAMARSVEAVFPYSTNHTARTWVITRSQAANPAVALGLLRDFPDVNLREAFRAVKVPIRCINAAPSRPGSTPTETEINRKHANYDAVFMAGVSHYPHLERPEEFNTKLRQIVRKIAR